MLLEKKSYFIDFSFKFNAIKFSNLLMNWFIREKMFTCESHALYKMWCKYFITYF